DKVFKNEKGYRRGDNGENKDYEGLHISGKKKIPYASFRRSSMQNWDFPVYTQTLSAIRTSTQTKNRLLIRIPKISHFHYGGNKICERNIFYSEKITPTEM